MLQFWSTWNFVWFVGSELNLIQKTNALKTSIIITSVLGGFMVYVYPRKLLIKTGKSFYNVPRNVMILSDILFHQLPFVSTFFLTCSSPSVFIYLFVKVFSALKLGQVDFDSDRANGFVLFIGDT